MQKFPKKSYRIEIRMIGSASDSHAGTALKHTLVCGCNDESFPRFSNGDAANGNAVVCKTNKARE